MIGLVAAVLPALLTIAFVLGSDQGYRAGHTVGFIEGVEFGEKRVGKDLGLSPDNGTRE